MQLMSSRSMYLPLHASARVSCARLPHTFVPFLDVATLCMQRWAEASRMQCIELSHLCSLHIVTRKAFIFSDSPSSHSHNIPFRLLTSLFCC